MEDELRFAGMIVAPEVVETIVKLSAETVEGVAGVGVSGDAGKLPLFAAKKPQPSTPGVEVRVEGDQLHIELHISVLFGYPFVTLADEVRRVVSSSVSSQVGAAVGGVDIYIDALVLPKE